MEPLVVDRLNVLAQGDRTEIGQSLLECDILGILGRRDRFQQHLRFQTGRRAGVDQGGLPVTAEVQTESLEHPGRSGLSSNQLGQGRPASRAGNPQVLNHHCYFSGLSVF